MYGLITFALILLAASDSGNAQSPDHLPTALRVPTAARSLAFSPETQLPATPRAASPAGRGSSQAYSPTYASTPAIYLSPSDGQIPAIYPSSSDTPVAAPPTYASTPAIYLSPSDGQIPAIYPSSSDSPVVASPTYPSTPALSPSEDEIPATSPSVTPVAVSPPVGILSDPNPGPPSPTLSGSESGNVRRLPSRPSESVSGLSGDFGIVWSGFAALFAFALLS